MKKRKVLATLMTTALVLSLAGCGGASKGESKSAESSDSSVANADKPLAGSTVSHLTVLQESLTWMH